MKLTKRNLMVVSVMLFALFFRCGEFDFSTLFGAERRGKYPVGNGGLFDDGGDSAGIGCRGRGSV